MRHLIWQEKNEGFFKIFSTGIKIGGVGASISYAAFEREDHFIVIQEGYSYCHLKADCHKGYKVGYAYSTRGITRGLHFCAIIPKGRSLLPKG